MAVNVSWNSVHSCAHKICCCMTRRVFKNNRITWRFWDSGHEKFRCRWFYVFRPSVIWKLIIKITKEKKKNRLLACMSSLTSSNTPEDYSAKSRGFSWNHYEATLWELWLYEAQTAPWIPLWESWKSFFNGICKSCRVSPIYPGCTDDIFHELFYCFLCLCVFLWLLAALEITTV